MGAFCNCFTVAFYFFHVNAYYVPRGVKQSSQDQLQTPKTWWFETHLLRGILRSKVSEGLCLSWFSQSFLQLFSLIKWSGSQGSQQGTQFLIWNLLLNYKIYLYSNSAFSCFFLVWWVHMTLSINGFSCDFPTNRGILKAQFEGVNPALHSSLESLELVGGFPRWLAMAIEWKPSKNPRPLVVLLGGGFRYFLFSSLFGEDSHFD